MFWWHKRKQHLRENIATERKATIEVIAHQRASRQVINDVKRATGRLNETLARNGFTVKIFLAAGGKPPVGHANDRH